MGVRRLPDARPLAGFALSNGTGVVVLTSESRLTDPQVAELVSYRQAVDAVMAAAPKGTTAPAMRSTLLATRTTPAYASSTTWRSIPTGPRRTASGWSAVSAQKVRKISGNRSGQPTSRTVESQQLQGLQR